MITSITAKRHMETKVLMAIGWQVVCTALSGQVHNGSPEEHLGLAMSPSTHTTVAPVRFPGQKNRHLLEIFVCDGSSRDIDRR